MSGFYEIDYQFSAGENDPDDYGGFEAFLDRITDELATAGFDADYTAAAANLRATWTLEVPDGSEESLIVALTAMQLALAAAGCFDDTRPADRPREHEVVGARRLVLA